MLVDDRFPDYRWVAYEDALDSQAGGSFCIRALLEDCSHALADAREMGHQVVRSAFENGRVLLKSVNVSGESPIRSTTWLHRTAVSTNCSATLALTARGLTAGER